MRVTPTPLRELIDGKQWVVCGMPEGARSSER